jgi:prepilin signal peptidase PulO-like enzyme (type II secretory pathway)
MLETRVVEAFGAGLFGLLFGSAINALVWRLYVGRSWVRGRSECPDCGHKLAVKDLVPVLSWVFLGGKCRYCQKPIKDHPVVELVTAVLFAVSVYALAPVTVVDWALAGVWLLILVMLIVLAVYDARWMILPDKVMVPLVGVAAVHVVALAVLAGTPRPVIGSLMAAVLAGGGFLALAVGTRGRALGGGDIKLAFVMGLLLGLTGTAVAMFIAFNVAALVGVALIASKRRRRRDHIPFGPFLVLGTVTAFLFADVIIQWYLGMNGIG